MEYSETIRNEYKYDWNKKAYMISLFFIVLIFIYACKEGRVVMHESKVFNIHIEVKILHYAYEIAKFSGAHELCKCNIR